MSLLTTPWDVRLLLALLPLQTQALLSLLARSCVLFRNFFVSNIGKNEQEFYSHAPGERHLFSTRSASRQPTSASPLVLPSIRHHLDRWNVSRYPGSRPFANVAGRSVDRASLRSLALFFVRRPQRLNFPPRPPVACLLPAATLPFNTTAINAERFPRRVPHTPYLRVGV
jgi:hypothetical protein